MNKLIWTLQILLTLAMALFGLQKVVSPIPDLIAQGMLWIEDFPVWQVRTIGALEVLGVLGLTLPYAVKRLPRVLIPLAAAGLAMTMVGAVATHVGRGDPAASIVVTGSLFVMAVVVAFRRWRELGEATGTAELAGDSLGAVARASVPASR